MKKISNQMITNEKEKEKKKKKRIIRGYKTYYAWDAKWGIKIL